MAFEDLTEARICDTLIDTLICLMKKFFIKRNIKGEKNDQA